MFPEYLIPLAPAASHDVNPASDHLYAPHSARAGEMHDAAVIDIIEHPTVSRGGAFLIVFFIALLQNFLVLIGISNNFYLVT